MNFVIFQFFAGATSTSPKFDLYFIVQASIHRPSVRRPHSSSIFSSETTGPVKAKFHMEPQWDRGTTVCSNDPGHVTKMPAMHIW